MAAGETYYDKVDFGIDKADVQTALDASYALAVVAGLTTPTLVQCDFVIGQVVWQEVA